MAEDGPTIRFGASWQDFRSPETGLNLRGELILPKPAALKDAFAEVFVPAPLIGLSAHLGRGTSFLYASALWTVPLSERLFLEFSVGGAVGNTVSGPEPGRAAMGCHGSFREEAGLGWKLDPSWSVVATVEHYSNAGLCNANRGLTNVGLLLGRSF